ncbi:MAG: histidinol-phosphate transaminase, partial [Asgard group archaeon]
VLLSDSDKVIIPAPTYGEYETAISKKGAKPIFLNLDQGKEFRIIYEDVIDRISYEKPKMVFICNPNNPPSKVVRREEMLSIVEECARKNVFVFVDEAYVDFVDKPWEVTVTPEVNDYWNLFVLHSITKIHGMPGLRVGYGISNHEFINLLERVKQPWNVNCLAQVASIEALKNEDHLRKTREIITSGRKYLAEKIESFKSLHLYKPEANFLLININKARMTAAQLKEKLARKRILIRDCSSFRNMDKYHVRVSVRTPEQNQKLIEALKITV